MCQNVECEINLSCFYLSGLDYVFILFVMLYPSLVCVQLHNFLYDNFYFLLNTLFIVLNTQILTMLNDNLF
jgi:hypothetical protein